MDRGPLPRPVQQTVRQHQLFSSSRVQQRHGGRRRPKDDLRPVVSTPPETIRPPDGVHRVGAPGAEPRRVAQARDHAPLRHGKPFVRQPRGDTRVTREDRRRAVAQRAAGVAERRANFDANNSQQLRRQGSTLGPCVYADPNWTLALLRPRVVHGGRKKCRHKPGSLQTHHELFPTNTGVMWCLAQPLRGSTTTKRAPGSTTRLNRLHTHTHSPKRLAHPRSPMSSLSTLTARATHARPLLPSALTSVPHGFVLL